jgi:hypothetical protein
VPIFTRIIQERLNLRAEIHLWAYVKCDSYCTEFTNFALALLHFLNQLITEFVRIPPEGLAADRSHGRKMEGWKDVVST